MGRLGAPRHEHMSSRRGRESPRLTVIYWRDIPAQGAGRTGSALPDRPSTARLPEPARHDEYIAEWREETRPCGEDLQAEADREAARIEEDYPPDLVRSYVRNGGRAP